MLSLTNKFKVLPEMLETRIRTKIALGLKSWGVKKLNIWLSRYEKKIMNIRAILYCWKTAGLIDLRFSISIRPKRSENTPCFSIVGKNVWLFEKHRFKY